MERFNKRETEIKFSSISPLELWENLGLAQPSRKKEQKMEETTMQLQQMKKKQN